jgi:hypothetical protein
MDASRIFKSTTNRRVISRKKVKGAALQEGVLGEKFRSDETKLCQKLYSFHDRTIHVRGGIYRALAFVF